MKFLPGENRFRILSSPILGNELWIAKKPVMKPLDVPFTREELENADTNVDGTPRTPKHFWAMPVLDYKDKAVKVLEITQATIQSAIKDLAADPDWGSPTGYDLVVSRQGEGMNTEYGVIPKPAKPLPDAAKELWDRAVEEGFSLEALFDGGDPFVPEAPVPVKAVPAPEEEINIDDIPF
jgi:hypothetical protein